MIDEPHPGPLQEPTSVVARARRLIGSIGAGLLFVLFKFKWLLFAAYKLKFVATIGSMLVSVWAYSLLFGWRFAALFIVLLFVHEIGHALWLKKEGIATSPIVFLPFLGAMISMRSMPRDAYVEAKVGLAGPILGSLGALAVYLAGETINSPLLIAAAYTGFFLNLFNLLPVLPLDGGRAAAALSPKLWLAGFAVLLTLAGVRPNPVLLLIVVFGGIELWRRWRSRHNDAEYYKLTTRQRVLIGGTYLALVAALWLGMTASYVNRS